MITPRTPPGVLELLPAKQLAFQRMLDTIRRGFERFGFLPIETPAFELSSVLLTKTGGDTEKQVYFVQSTGAIEQAKAPELALRFDLTVPLARYVAEHEHELNFPFRRYQIQRVYRGERNQKGRFREFYQCDIDVIDRDRLPLAHDAELPAVIHGIFRELAIGDFTIYINNRKLLRGLLDTLGYAADHHERVLHAVDRLRKTGPDEVAREIATTIPGADPAALLGCLRGTLDDLDALPGASATLREGVAELRAVHAGTLALGVPAAAAVIDLSIVRGLDYYTGTVYETFLDAHPQIGSICSGGRYDNLAGHYSKSKLPGVGISIGATRLFWQLDQLGALPHAAGAVAQVVVTSSPQAAQIATELRTAGVAVEVYAGDDKLAKQLKYADRGKVPLVAIAGADAHDPVKLKDLRVEGRAPEVAVARGELVATIRGLLAPRSQAPEVHAPPTSALPRWLADAIAALVAGDADGWVRIYAADAVHEFPLAPEGRPRRLDGRAAIAANMRETLARVRFEPFVHFHARTAGDEVIVEAVGHHHRIADGSPVDVRSIWFITVRDGLVTHFRDYMIPLPASPR